MENGNTLSKTLYRFSEKTEIIQSIVIGLIAFLVPSFLAQLITTIFGANSIITNNSQIIVGSIVNVALIISAINISDWKKIVGIITMPSISTILSGYIFGSASVFMVYMIPAIWLGNFTLIYFFKFIMLKKKQNYFLASILGIILKVIIIFSSFKLLNLFNIFPVKLVNNLQTAMGMTQLITASIGMILSFIVYKAEKARLVD